MLRRRGETCLSIFVLLLLAILALIPFTFFLVVSLSPGYITTLSLARVTGEVRVAGSEASVPVMVTVGPTGGCMWYDVTSGAPTKCIRGVPFVPDPSVLHLPPNDTFPEAFPIAMCRAVVMNHVVTALAGLCLLAAAVDMLVLRGGACLALTYLTVLMMWITFILETTYISVLHKRLDEMADDGGGKFHYHVGNGYWMVLAATMAVSFLICGNGSIELGGENNNS